MRSNLLGGTKANIIANISGGIFTGLLSIIFIPIYIRLIGIESYGLIGFFSSLASFLSILDLGLGSSLNREIARLSVIDNSAKEMRNLARSVEIPFGLIGFLLAIVITMAAPWIATHWIHSEGLSTNSLRTSVVLMGISLAFQWPTSLYANGLNGLQRQVLLNLINGVTATARSVGSIAALVLIQPTVEVFFGWQIVVGAIQTAWTAFAFWRALPSIPEKTEFQFDLLYRIRKFAAGLTAITITIAFLQVDKIILSHMLPLKSFGYYVLANSIAMTIYRLVTPVFTAVFPKLTQLVQKKKTDELASTYHRSSQLLAFLTIPLATVLVFFSSEILLLWTKSTELAIHSSFLLSILVISACINGLMNTPYALQLAHGWTRLTLTFNLIYVILMVPMMVLATRSWGAIGAACFSLTMNLGYLAIEVPIMHHRLLPSEMRKWYAQDIGRPLLAALAVGMAGRIVIHHRWPLLWQAAGIALTGAGCLMAAALAANQIHVIQEVKSFLSHRPT